MGAAPDVRISACRFNAKSAESLASLPSGVLKFDVPCYGAIFDAVMQLFAIENVAHCAKKMKIKIPEYRIDTFLQGKVENIKEMVAAARARPDCTGKNLEAANNLEKFANDFAALDEKKYTNMSD